MERLNEIFAHPPQRHQQDDEQRLQRNNGPSSQAQRPGMRYTLPEQTAHLGPGSQSSRPGYQHKMPHHTTRGEPGQPLQQAHRPNHSQQWLETNEPGASVSYQQPPQRQTSLNEYPRTEDFAPTRDRNWGAPRSAPADSIDAYSPVVQADVLEELEDDAADIRYGDWENDGIEEYTSYRSQEPGGGANSMLPRGRPADGNSRTYPQSNRSLITRELRKPAEGESSTQVARNAGDFLGQPKQLPSPQYATQEVRRSLRTTQPLRPQATVRASQEMLQEGTHTQKPVLQAARREQAMSFKPVSLCPICKGAGYLRADVPYGHPSFGKPIACECKEAERKEKRRRQLQEMSNLGAFNDKSFQNFNPRVPGLQQAFEAAYEFAQNPNGWLLLIGPNGCGKTHLAAAIANQSLDDGALVLFATVPDLLDHLRAAFAPNSTEVYDQLFARMREAEVLVLDDLGAQQSSSWANEKLFQLLNYRYNFRFPTVITANSRGLLGIDERIRSRLTDVSLVTSVILDRARDYRPHNPRRD